MAETTAPGRLEPYLSAQYYEKFKPNQLPLRSIYLTIDNQLL